MAPDLGKIVRFSFIDSKEKQKDNEKILDLLNKSGIEVKEMIRHSPLLDSPYYPYVETSEGRRYCGKNGIEQYLKLLKLKNLEIKND